jgi:hypothetical protein
MSPVAVFIRWAGWLSFAQDTRQVTEPKIPPACAQLAAQLLP